MATPRYVSLSALARSDLRKAHEWYEEQLPRLGRRSLQAFVMATDAVAERPTSFPEVQDGVRRAILPKFPFGVFFGVVDDVIRVVGVIDLRSDDRKWRNRLRDDHGE